MDPSADDIKRARSLEDHDLTLTNTPSQGTVYREEKCRNKRGWRRVVINLTPAWYSVTMGTGITSILLHNLPYNATWIYWISVVLFAVNVAIFILLTVLSLLRYILFPGIWSCMSTHPVQSLFLGTVPMGLATIINMVVFVGVPAWGPWAATLAWTLWWIDVVLSLGTNLIVPFIVICKHESRLSNMTAAWLLPIVATIVAAATGGIVANVLPNDQHSLWTIIVSYVLWGCGVPLAMFILVIYLHRLTMHSLPPREVIVSVFLPLGPIGQGAFGIIILGRDALNIFNRTNSIPAATGSSGGSIFYVNGLFIGLTMWGFGFVWLFFALASIARSTFPFNLGWWGFTFPLGVYATATVAISQELPSPFFKVLGTVFSLSEVLLWVVVSIGTLRKVFTGGIFVAPCAEQWEARQVQRRRKRSDESEA